MDFTNFRFARRATEVEVATRKRSTLSVLHSDPERPHAGGRAPRAGLGLEEPFPPIPDELIAYLKMIRDDPGIPATERDKKHGIGLKKGSEVRKRLKEAGLIETYNANPGVHGRNFKDARLTERGKALLSKNLKAEQDEGTARR